ncbi:Cyclin-J18 [Forsythia ovata]|uniref:Cyclin-J18 n=1 Tax=Forsythia ovata TaxID=205694 RepID=A0ABD1X6W8_9LAMI
MRSQQCSCLRSRVIEFLIQSAHLLEVSPIVKYSALSLFADRFYPALARIRDGKGTENWLLHPMRESNLQLFGLISIWVSSKVHDTPSLCVKNLKPLADKFIKEQHFTTRDLLEAEITFLQVIEFGIGVTNIAFIFVEELLSQLKVVSRVGEHVKVEACMDIMDLLYEKEETSVLYRSPHSLAASILVASYLITVPQQKWEFPVLPWGKISYT